MLRRISGIFSVEEGLEEELASLDSRTQENDSRATPKAALTSKTKATLSKIRRKKKKRSSVEACTASPTSESSEEETKVVDSEEGPFRPDSEEELDLVQPTFSEQIAAESNTTDLKNPVDPASSSQTMPSSASSVASKASATKRLATKGSNSATNNQTRSVVAKPNATATSKTTPAPPPVSETAKTTQVATTKTAQNSSTTKPAPTSATTSKTPVPASTKRAPIAPGSESKGHQNRQEILTSHRRWQSDRLHDRTSGGGGAFGAPRGAYKDKEDEICDLLDDIRRIGGGPCVTFGNLFDDDHVQNRYEALVGTLKGARKRGYIAFQGQMLLKGIHDKVTIQILKDIHGRTVEAIEGKPAPQDVADKAGQSTKSSKLPSVSEGRNTESSFSGSATTAPVTPPRNDRDMPFAPSPAMTKTPSPFRPFSPCTPPTPSSPATNYSSFKANSSYTSSTAAVNSCTKKSTGPAVARKKWTPPKRSLSTPGVRTTPWGVPVSSSWTPPVVSSSTVVRASQRRSTTAAAPTVSPYRKTRAKSVAGGPSLATQEVQQGIDDEIHELLNDIRRVGEEGEPNVTFGQLFDDDIVQNRYEALVGTLKGARKRGYIHFAGQILLKGMHDGVTISIVDRDDKGEGALSGGRTTVSGPSITAVVATTTTVA